MNIFYNLNDKIKYLQTLERISNAVLLEDSHIYNPHGAIPIRQGY